MTYTTQERKSYNLHRDRVCKDMEITKNQYNYIRRIGNGLQTLFTDNCNGTIEENAYFMEAEKLTNKLEKYLDNDIKFYIQSDPRGATVYISKNSLNSTNYTSGSCIY